MVLRAMRAAALLTAALALGSCQVLEFMLGSVFPASVTLLKASADLSGKIPASKSDAMRLRVVESGGKTYVIVVGTLPGGTTATAFIYDDKLSFRKKLASLSGDGVMVDGSGSIVVGNTLLSPSDLAVTGSLPAIILSSNGVPCGVGGFLDSSSNEIVNVFITEVPSNQLSYLVYAPGWGTLINSPSDAISDNRLDGVFDDAGAGTVVLATHNGGGNQDKGVTCHFVTIPKDDFSSGLTAGDLTLSASRDDLLAASIGFVKGSILAYDVKTSSFVRLNPATGSTRDSFAAGTDFSSMVFAYPPSGGSFFAFDTDKRVLTKYAQWW